MSEMDVNYDESKIPPYTIDDVLTFVNGDKVKGPADWPLRRAEIVKIFEREMYGRIPPQPESVITELMEEGVTLAGLGIRRQYRMWFKSDKSGPYVDWLLVLPNRIKGVKPQITEGRVFCENEQKCPIILMLNYRGNHIVLTDKEVIMPQADIVMTPSESGCCSPSEDDRGSMRLTSSSAPLPVETICARGYALLTACYRQVSPDICGYMKKDESTPSNYSGVFDLWPRRDESDTDNITSLGAWAWALSRGLDLAFTIPEIDATKSVATGYSRLAKSALLACSRDERFNVCVPNQTGGGGAPLAKRYFGESVYTEMRSFPHWYCKAYGKYADNEAAMKFDQHFLLASIAPRALLVQGYNSGWFDTKGEYLACKAASAAWTINGLEGLPDGDFPENYSNALIGKNLGYVRRGGEHGMSGYDWEWCLDFADRALAVLSD